MKGHPNFANILLKSAQYSQLFHSVKDMQELKVKLVTDCSFILSPPKSKRVDRNAGLMH